MKPGDRVQTNKRFSGMWPEGCEWRGELIDRRVSGEKKPVPQWRVRVDGMRNMQTIAEHFLVKEKK